MRCGEDDVETPVVEADIFGADGTDAVYDDESGGRYAVDEFGEGFDFAEDAGGGVDVGHGEDFVGLFLERGFHGIELWAVADRGFQLRRVDAVSLKAVGEGIGKVAGVQDKDVVARFGQVGGYEVPAEGTAAGDDEGLRGWVAGLEYFAQHLQCLSEDVDKGHADVGFTAVQLARIETRRGPDSRIVAHGVKNGIVELNWPWYQQRRMRRLVRGLSVCHFGR